jgi:hypothetical protein
VLELALQAFLLALWQFESQQFASRSNLHTSALRVRFQPQRFLPALKPKLTALLS